MKVRLQEVLETLEGAGIDVSYYYDTKYEEIEDGFIEDFIPLLGHYDIKEYRMMESFVY